MKAAAGEVRQFPWDEVIALGLGLLRLAPRDFWSMTPREFSLVLRILDRDRAGSTPTRAALATLMQMFPDGKEREQR